jgi:hypothetical protein
MIVAGKIYQDASGTELGQMNTSHGGLGDFWCAKLGDGRYYSSQGTCLSLFGEVHAENPVPTPSHNIIFEGA